MSITPKGDGWVVFSYVPNVGDCVRDLDDPYGDQEQVACAHAALQGAAERTGNAAIVAAAHAVATSRDVADYTAAMAVLRAAIA